MTQNLEYLLQACQEICARSYREWRAEEEVMTCSP
jgi:hypothetical protein